MGARRNFAVFGHPNAAVLTYYGLFALQHQNRARGGRSLRDRREVFKNLERVTDAFEDVANAIDGIVIDHA